MAKIKVHELAKELDKQSKDILKFLQEKGIEAKVAQSSIEEAAAEMVRKAFGGSGTKEPLGKDMKAGKTGSKAETEKAETKTGKEETKVEKSLRKSRSSDRPKVESCSR